MMEIVGIENLVEIHHYEVLYFTNTNIEFMKFLSDFGFSDKEVDKMDIAFVDKELKGVYFFLEKKNMKIHLFFEEDIFHMVIDSPLSTKQLNNKLKKHFIFPSEGK